MESEDEWWIRWEKIKGHRKAKKREEVVGMETKRD